MPSLGSLLKKKRTKDSTSSTGASAAAESTPRSPVDGGAIDRVLSKNSAFSNEPDAIAGTGDSVPPTSTAAAPGDDQNMKQHGANAPTIQNLINQPSSQHDSAYSSGTSNDGSSSQTGAAKGAGNPVRETKGKYALGDFNFQRTLGTGSFGRVHLVQSKHNQRFYAVKVLKKAQVVKMKQVEHTNDERKMLQRCRHPFLITLWGTWQDAKNLYMVMDFIEGGELFSLLRKSQVSLLPEVL